MIEDDAFTWTGLAIILALILLLLSGCAAEPQAPIETYRALYGFTPTRD